MARKKKEQPTPAIEYRCRGVNQNPGEIMKQLSRRGMTEVLKAFDAAAKRVSKKSGADVTTAAVLEDIEGSRVADAEKRAIREAVGFVGRCGARLNDPIGAAPADGTVQELECPACGNSFTVRKTPPDPE